MPIVTGEDARAQARLRMALVGGVGSGKTWAAASTRRTVVLAVEDKAIPVVLAANPEAGIVRAPEFATLRAEVKALAASHELCSGRGCAGCRGSGFAVGATDYRVLVVDNATAVFDLALDHYTRATQAQRRRRDERRGDRAAQLEHDAEQGAWFLVERWMDACWRRLHSLPLHVITLMHSGFRIRKTKAGLRIHEPELQGELLRRRFKRHFSAVGILHAARTPAGVDRKVIFDPGHRIGQHAFAARPLPGLPAVAPASAAAWVAAHDDFYLRGGDAPAPEPIDEAAWVEDLDRVAAEEEAADAPNPDDF